MSDAQEKTALAIVETLVPAQLYAPGNIEDVVSKIETQVRTEASKLDISSRKNREAIIKLAAKVASSKVAMDNAGKALTEEWTKRKNAVDAERRIVRDRMDALRDETRKPVTDWENEEKARIAAHEEAVASIKRLGVDASNLWETADLDAMQGELHTLSGRNFQEFAQPADKAKEEASLLIAAAVVRKAKHAAEQAELERLRAEEAERSRIAALKAQAEREAEIARQAAEQAKAAAERAAKEAADREAARAKAEQDRIEAEKQAAERRAQAAERARLDAVAKAEADQKEAVEAERRRVAAMNAVKQAEDERRAANKAHQAKINREAAAALAEIVGEDKAREVVTAVARNAIPHITIGY